MDEAVKVVIGIVSEKPVAGIVKAVTVAAGSVRVVVAVTAAVERLPSLFLAQARRVLAPNVAKE